MEGLQLQVRPLPSFVYDISSLLANLTEIQNVYERNRIS